MSKIYVAPGQDPDEAVADFEKRMAAFFEGTVFEGVNTRDRSAMVAAAERQETRRQETIALKAAHKRAMEAKREAAERKHAYGNVQRAGLGLFGVLGFLTFCVWPQSGCGHGGRHGVHRRR